MVSSERYLMHRLEVAEDAARRGLIKGNANRTRHLAELHSKAASGWKPPAEEVAETEARMARNREEARQTLIAGPPAARPTTGTDLGMMASAAQQAAGANRVRRGGRAWQVGAARREAARQRWAEAAPEGSQVGAHRRALESIARHNP
jgi:hypothetical protein